MNLLFRNFTCFCEFLKIESILNPNVHSLNKYFRIKHVIRVKLSFYDYTIGEVTEPYTLAHTHKPTHRHIHTLTHSQ